MGSHKVRGKRVLPGRAGFKARMPAMPSLGLCVIARDAAETLGACLASVRGLVDRMVVADTGAGDGESATSAVAIACGARVVKFSWANDFAAARNCALAEMDTDWVLVLDADEELDGAAHAWIRRELRAPQADGYVVPVRNYLQPWDEPLGHGVVLAERERHPRAPDARLYAPSEVCRLFKRDAAVYYVGKVHEQVEYRMLELGRKIAVAGFLIHHFGWYLLDVAGAQRKRALYRQLLEEKLRERPEDAQVLMQYGDALCNWCGQLQEGLKCLMRSASLRPEYVEIWTHIAPVLVKLGQMEAALVAVAQIPEHGPLAGRRAQLMGDVLAGMGRWDEASRAYAVALEHYPGFVGVRAKLGLLQQAAGDEDGGRAQVMQAARQAEAAARARPSAQALQRSAELYAQMKEWGEVLRLVEEGLQYAAGESAVALQELRLRAAVAEGHMAQAALAAGCLAASQPSPKASLRQAAIWMQRGDHARARAALREGLERFPQAGVLQRAMREMPEAADGEVAERQADERHANKMNTNKSHADKAQAEVARAIGWAEVDSPEMKPGEAAQIGIQAAMPSSFALPGR